MDRLQSFRSRRQATQFAPAERADPRQIQRDVVQLSRHPVIDSLMTTVGGCLAVLNEQRQILCLNHRLLELLEIDDPHAVFGLRPGEALHCVHHQDHPGGCGTSQACRRCGVAIAAVACRTENEPQEEVCVATVQRDERPVDFTFRVRCSPLTLGQRRYLLLFLQDITLERQRASLERVFFHDVQNTLAALKLNCQLLEQAGDASQEREPFLRRIGTLAETLANEIEVQRVLSKEDHETYPVAWEPVSTETLRRDLEGLFHLHPVARERILKVPDDLPTVTVRTDARLVRRILINMLTNAFEATAPGGQVRLWWDATDDAVVFSVWNDGVIPDDVACRIFQRHFTTKTGSGRGLGTYSMKLFGQTYLKGQVGFTTSAKEGTVFQLRLPRDPRAAPEHGLSQA